MLVACVLFLLLYGILLSTLSYYFTILLFTILLFYYFTILLFVKSHELVIAMTGCHPKFLPLKNITGRAWPFSRRYNCGQSYYCLSSVHPFFLPPFSWKERLKKKYIIIILNHDTTLCLPYIATFSQFRLYLLSTFPFYRGKDSRPDINSSILLLLLLLLLLLPPLLPCLVRNQTAEVAK